jgi:hypothetical protein
VIARALALALLLGTGGCGGGCVTAEVPGPTTAQRAAEAGPPRCYIEFHQGNYREYELRTTRGRVLGLFSDVDGAWRAAKLYECPVTIDPTIDP